tara:strand:+ start:4824 stop:5462 length:639 start_codon:yes stop_codon:yes gene_type:complete
VITINLATQKKSNVVSVEGEESKKSGILDRLSGDGFSNKSAVFQSVPIIGIALTVIVYFGGGYFLDSYKEEELTKLNLQFQEIMNQQTKMQVQLKKLKNYKVLQAKIEKEERKLRTKIETIEALVAQRERSYQSLKTIGENIPSEVWLSNLSVKEGVVNFEGGATGLDYISDFMKILNESVYFSNLKLKSTAKLVSKAGIEYSNFSLSATRR